MKTGPWRTLRAFAAMGALLVTTGWPGIADADPTPGPVRAPLIAAADLQADAAVLRRAYQQLHPGLYRYRTRAQVDAAFAELGNEFGRDRTLADAYLAIARLTTYIQCGHTYPNFFNQNDALKQALLERPRVPFEFRWLDGRMVITRSYADLPGLQRGAEVLAIDGRPVARILAALLPYSRADGGNEGGDSVGDRILAHLSEQDLPAEPVVRKTHYRKVPADLRPLLETWDPSFYDWGDTAIDLGDGFYRLTKYDDDTAGGAVVKALTPRYPGRVWVLIGAANSSATFEFAAALQRHRLGTLVGQTTGGNQRGITGGAFFFLRLPKTGIEADVPVQPRIEDIAAGRDAELEEVLRLIAVQRS